MKTGIKLTLGFSFIVLAMLLTVAFCLNTGEKIHEEFETLKDDIVPGAIAMADMAHYADKIHLCIMEHIVVGGYGQEELQPTMQLLEKAGVEHLEHEKHIGLEEKIAAEELQVKIQRVNSAALEMVNLKDQGRSVNELTSKEDEVFHPAMAALLKQLNEHKATHMAELAAAQEAVHHAHTSSERIALLVSAIVAFLAAVFAFAMTRSITKPLTALHRGTEMIGSGKLDYKVATDAKDEIGQLSRAFDKMTENLQETMASRDELNAANQQLQASEQQLKAANQQLRAGEQQLKAANQQLRAGEQQLKAANQQLRAGEQQLKAANQQLNTANQTKSQFLANMSHEIRTPMNAIIGFADVLAEEKLTDKQKSYVEIVRENGEALLRLIDDILDISKIEAGKLNVETINCSLEKLLANIESVMRPAAAKKDLEFEVLQCEKLPGQILTDPTRLRQCLINLVNNAIKFTEAGHVYVNVSLQEDDNKPYIRFDVEDTGVGIPAERQEVIFESFTQADGTTCRKFGGTGLGLTITKQLADLLGGKLTLTSQIGKGSVFSLIIPANVDVDSELPLDKYEVVNHLNQSTDNCAGTQFTGRILVAEDAKDNQRLIKLLLEKLGFEVTIAEDGEQAVAKALAEQFDLIFMDIQMPKLDGFEATKQLRKEAVTVPIVALTAFALKGDEQKCIAAGCDDYMSKPINHDKLSRVLSKYLAVNNNIANIS